MKNFTEIAEPTKHLLDTVSGLTAIGTIIQILPAIAALFSIIWYAVRIYDRFKPKK